MKSLKQFALTAALVSLLAACGGGGGASVGNTSGSTSGSTGSSSSGSTSTSNTVGVVVDAGPAAAGGTANEPFVSVTICSPASPTTCQTIDHILVDTGSYGLRIMSSVLSSSLDLPLETDSSGNAYAECAMFADGYSWGSVRTANLQIGGESATSLPIHVIGDPAYANMVPSACASTGTSENTVSTFGANGVIGLGPFAQDCGTACAQDASEGLYYVCSSSCQPSTMPLAQQVPNPITLFATDNNGSSLTFPSVPAGGTVNLAGTLTFGIGTQSNNGLGSAVVYTTDDYGYITTQYKGQTYVDSFIDSGSNGYFFTDSSITQCSDGSGFYCPTSALNLTAVNSGQNGQNGTVNFVIGNALNQFDDDPDSTAYSEIGGVNGDSQSFDWGLPFFFGRTVYTAIEGYTAGGTVGPYLAY
jgi:hypothetical protein